MNLNYFEEEIKSNNLLDSFDVYIRIGFIKLFDLDTLNQRFNCEALIESKW